MFWACAQLEADLFSVGPQKNSFFLGRPALRRPSHSSQTSIDRRNGRRLLQPGTVLIEHYQWALNSHNVTYL